METTFISIHDLSLDARLLYVSTSITDILGYWPEEVVGKSCWEYFHPDEIPFARAIHGRGVQLDKAAVLNYCQIKNRDGRWVGCECVFTVVHDVLVGCTSIYKRGVSSQKRAAVAPAIRQLFSSSPKDPRYHMLSYISHKFSQEIKPQAHEPRAALFLNRFTRTLTIVYATNGLANLLGITANQLCGKSFYYCIQENCLKDAVKCLESAKANDSIAYLRFWFRDPRLGDPSQDEHMDGISSGEDDDGGVHVDVRMEEDLSEQAVASDSSTNHSGSAVGQSSTDQVSMERDLHRLAPQNSIPDPNSRSSSGNSTDLNGGSNEAIFDQPTTRHSSVSSMSFFTSDEGQRSSNMPRSPGPHHIELEAVVSCTSDGLVVVLRRARALVPQVAQPTTAPVRRHYENGIFASPWATDPMLPDIAQRRHGESTEAEPDLAPLRPTVAQADSAAMRGPDQEDFMNSIREVAVFAWALTGINGSLARYGRGKSTGESLPPAGLPIWKPDSHTMAELQRHHYHGNSPQDTRHSLSVDERKTEPIFGYSNPLPHERNHGYCRDTADGYHPSYTNGHSSTSPNQSTDHFGNGTWRERYSEYGNGSQTQNTSPGSYDHRQLDEAHNEPVSKPNHDFQTGGNGNIGTHYAGTYNGNHFGYNGAMHFQPQNGQHSVDTKDAFEYISSDSNHHDQYGSQNGTKPANGSPWLPVVQPH